MDPFITGSLISAGASILGGIFDRKDQKASAAHNMQSMIDVGRRNKLHPSVAIGANIPGYTPAFGGALSEAGRSIQQGLSARESARLQRENQQKQNDLIDAQILESTSRTMLNNANTRRTMLPPGGTMDPFAMRQENALIRVKLENGEVVTIPNPDVYEISPTELATGRIILEGGRVIERGSDGNWKIEQQSDSGSSKARSGRGAGDFNEYDPAAMQYGNKGQRVFN